MAAKRAKKANARQQAAEGDQVASAVPREMIKCSMCFDETQKSFEDIRGSKCSLCAWISWAQGELAKRIKENAGTPAFVRLARAKLTADEYNAGKVMEKGYWNARGFVCTKCGAPHLCYIKIHDSGKVDGVVPHDYDEEFCVHCKSLKASIYEAKMRKWKHEERERFKAEERKRLEKEEAARAFRSAVKSREASREDDIPF